MRQKGLRQLIIVGVLSTVICSTITADIWHLKDGQDWEKLAEGPRAKYLLAVAQIKQLINQGEVKAALEQLEQLKADFPDIAGADLDMFIEAEELYARAKWDKAGKKYIEFLDNYPESDLYYSALERMYSIAVGYLGGQKRTVLKVLRIPAYDNAARIMNDIADRTGDAPIAKRALLTLAKSQEERGKHREAYETWVDISSRWPTGKLRQEAMMAMARNLYLAYGGHEYDDSVIKSAKSYYNNYKLRYSDAAEEQNVEETVANIDEKAAMKQYETGAYYERTGSELAANLYYQMVIDKWPGSEAAEKAKEALGAKVMSADEDVKESKPAGRSLFEGANTFLDNWFGLSKPKE